MTQISSSLPIASSRQRAALTQKPPSSNKSHTPERKRSREVLSSPQPFRFLHYHTIPPESVCLDLETCLAPTILSRHTTWEEKTHTPPTRVSSCLLATSCLRRFSTKSTQNRRSPYWIGLCASVEPSPFEHDELVPTYPNTYP